MKILLTFALGLFLFSCINKSSGLTEKRPNIIFIMTNDYASQTISSYGSTINKTPNIDQLAENGRLFKNAFVTNVICGPSRAVILSGRHSHLNGMIDNHTRFDSTQLTFPKILRKNGYEAAIVGKGHLESEPTGFDYWNILPGQGDYYNPGFINNGKDTSYNGYVTNITADLALDWLSKRKSDRPFMLMVHQKAPRRNWMPDLDDLEKYEDIEFVEPATFHDDYIGTEHLKDQKLTVAKHMDISLDLKVPCDTCWRDEVNSWALRHSKKKLGRLNSGQRAKWDAGYETEIEEFFASDLTEEGRIDWNFKRHVQDYLRCIVSVDESVGIINSYVEDNSLAENTIIIYTSDQGFFLGEHGLCDKRYMYEETLRTPLIIKYPGVIEEGATSSELVQNLDIAPTILDIAGVEIPKSFQGKSLTALFDSPEAEIWREGIYYHFYESGWGVPKHHGIRTKDYKLIHFELEPASWELYDLNADPKEMNKVDSGEDFKSLVEELKNRFKELTGEV
ncbi:MAG: sulfatase [Saprospiraceae bacterium]|nr:sulfatase [Saprospiraceae bacterium]